jgi:predicted dehydrogenase
MNEEGRRSTSLPGGHVEGFADTFKNLYAAVYRAVAEGKPGAGYPTFADGHEQMLVNEAVRLSSSARTWIDVKR